MSKISKAKQKKLQTQARKKAKQIEFRKWAGIPSDDESEEDISANYDEPIVNPTATPPYEKSKNGVSRFSERHEQSSMSHQSKSISPGFSAKKRKKLDMSSMARLEVIMETNSGNNNASTISQSASLSKTQIEFAKKRALLVNKHEKPTFDELQQQRSSLPIFYIKNELMSLFSKESCIVLKGETGSGKTTQIPQYLLEGGFLGKLAVAVTQPRRVAAITIAERVAEEVGTTLGSQVGYCIRFDDTTSNETKIKYVTDGMLLRESISDPLLTSYSWIILDEAHERTIHTDVLFGIVKAAQSKRRGKGFKSLKIIIMSATIDEEKLSSYFNKAPVFDIPGREYIIEIHNSRREEDDYVRLALSTVVHIHESWEQGDILVFLTGEEEIDSAVSEMQKIILEFSEWEMKLFPFPLYASLPSIARNRALAPLPPSIRKVIFATNIAETSLTIPGIKYIVDSGKVKCKVFNPVSGLDSLKVESISKAQAYQRSGRAGRESKGFCFRLYLLEQFQEFKDFPIPEILRCNLCSVILQIAALGISNLKEFDFLDRPSDENIDAAIEQLILLGAVKGDNSNLLLTDLGRKMVNFPLDPRFSKIIISSVQYRCTREILTIISLLSVESIFLTGISEREAFQRVRCRFNAGVGDHMMLLNLARGYKKSKFSNQWCLDHFVNPRNLSKAMKIRKQLHQICLKSGIAPDSTCADDTVPVRKCLSIGLFMNAACLYKKMTYKTISNKEKVYIHPSSSLFKSRIYCCIYTELVQTTKNYMRYVSVVDEDWLLDAAPDYFKQRNFKRRGIVAI